MKSDLKEFMLPTSLEDAIFFSNCVLSDDPAKA